MCLFLIGTDVDDLKFLCQLLCLFIYYWYIFFDFISIFSQFHVRSDQGGSRNLFSIIQNHANKLSDVTLVSDDRKPFRAHKGSKHQGYNDMYVFKEES